MRQKFGSLEWSLIVIITDRIWQQVIIWRIRTVRHDFVRFQTIHTTEQYIQSTASLDFCLYKTIDQT